MPDVRPDDQRLIDLELIVTHLQRDLDQFNTVLIEQQKQIDLLKRSLVRLNEQIEDLRPQDDERSPQSEKPPHY
jgi:SlyX protein